MKRRINLLASVIVFLSFVGVQAQTPIDSGYCGANAGGGTNLTWTLYSDSTLIIGGYGNMEGYAHYIGCYPPWSLYSNQIQTIIIGNSVNRIGSEAFLFYNALTSVTIGNSVVTIGLGAFAGCIGLTSITIPNSVTSIERGAFGSCVNFSSLTVHAITPPILDTMYNVVFYNVPDTIPVYVPCESISAYRNSAGWDYFSNYIGVTNTAFIFDTICSGTDYNDNGFSISEGAGMYYDTLQSVLGCDSIVCLMLAEYPYVPITTYSISICEGEAYSDANFTDLTQAGTYYDTLQNIHGCDSVIELNLIVHALSVPFSYSISICENETYTDSNFTNLTQAGTYYDTLQNTNGCDSIIELTLTVNHTYIMQICDSIYIGNSYDFHGKLLTENGVYYDTLQTIDGCDSIIELTLTVTGVGIVEASYELQVTSYEIYDMLGRNLTASLRGTKCRSNPEIIDCFANARNDASELPSGIYIIKIQTNKGIITKKIIKLN